MNLILFFAFVIVAIFICERFFSHNSHKSNDNKVPRKPMRSPQIVDVKLIK